MAAIRLKGRYYRVFTETNATEPMNAIDRLLQVMRDLRAHACDMLTVGQYLQPSRHHLPVARFWQPEEFESLGAHARALGFSNVASGPLVRSSYHADLQAAGESVA